MLVLCKVTINYSSMIMFSTLWSVTSTSQWLVILPRERESLVLLKLQNMPLETFWHCSNDIQNLTGKFMTKNYFQFTVTLIIF